MSLILFGSIHTSRLPNPPPPPPGSGTALGKALTHPDLLSVSLERKSRPASSKWVHCNRAWREVTRLIYSCMCFFKIFLLMRSSCPIVFLDPDFSEHQEFCSVYGKHSGVYSGTFHFWLFDPATRGGPFQYCFHMPSSFCEDCGRHDF